MSQKSKQKSRSKPQLEDYGFSPSLQSQLFEHYAQFRDDKPALGPVLGHPSPSERQQQLLDKELELSPQPNAYGAKIPVSLQLNISVWRHYLTDYVDHVVLDFLQFGWPINYTSSVLPQPTHTNHQSALAYPEDVQHYLSTELSFGALDGPFKKILYRTTLLHPLYRQSTNVVLLSAGS
ncbi:unnamed protein product [Porites evermanni]|uniref:Uncharacterized protein n=1 Tax=Porites evermanni TaxID=104178 RepID=A0ABN8MRL6_9CNID|nr:unnamed protein product [Porites evermanni]